MCACLTRRFWGRNADELTQSLFEEVRQAGVALFRRKYLTEGRFVFRSGTVSDVPLPSQPEPWQMWEWLLPLTSPVSPEGMPEALSSTQRCGLGIS